MTAKGFQRIKNIFFIFQLVVVIHKDQMAILVVLMEYAVVKLISLVANVIHVRLDIPTSLHAKVKNSAKVKRFFNALRLKF